MCKKLNFDSLVTFVCRQVPEADPEEVKQYLISYAFQSVDFTTAYLFARDIEKDLIRKGRI